jgi:hypothetical protein
MERLAQVIRVLDNESQPIHPIQLSCPRADHRYVHEATPLPRAQKSSAIFPVSRPGDEDRSKRYSWF